ncbi:NADH-quinone oxidoreductase subunit I 1 [Striga asiatica]|uniref:NADH-quinone oxidoreductase subunit I 1 n=1 Tax=Striga asiatica TaxID=4170 RepID=A0A5A7Q847_STRAF|nr:NADH-quinone oxidoreductase subunit I 1 [Striga asiatica]
MAEVGQWWVVVCSGFGWSVMWLRPRHLCGSGVYRKQAQLVIKNGQSTRLNEMNWVPGLNGKKPELRTEVDGSLFWVKDLILAGGVNWDTTLVRALNPSYF